MAHIPDLSPCNYLPLSCEALLSVGWLEHGSQFVQGAVSETFFTKLKELCKSPWEPVVSLGIHHCSLCQFESPGFTANVFVPFENRIFVAPVAIVHYIAAHWYQPPEIFIRAVLECPEMNSMQYKKAILANGGRSLVNSNAA
ncbi:MAG: hypothetical protein Q8R67_26770 [Rhodoferax sp.]|nr:hypothetical protein [Rhodoferax sp.]MDP3655280.1 hypothetical protein [Rhodoferax sp.]